MKCVGAVGIVLEIEDKLIDLILELDPNYFYPQYNPYSD